MADSKKGRKRDKPMCKYGLTCYRKSAEHLSDFRHPSPLPSTERDSTDSTTEASKPKIKKIATETSKPKIATEASKPKTDKIATEKDVRPSSTNVTSTISSKDKPKTLNHKNTGTDVRPPSPVNIADNIKEKFLVEMPNDFYELWKFCSSLSVNPSESFSDLGLHLVGPYDVLAKKINNRDIISDNILRHWRYYFDPPEFQTVIKRDGDDCYHIGYFRDDPSEMPFGVASNSASVGPSFNLMGDNIFAALNTEIIRSLKKSRKSIKAKYEPILQSLQRLAKKLQYSLDVETPKTKARKKAVRAKTFHGFGIVVPYSKETGIGYRPVPETDAELKKILKRMSLCETEDEVLRARVPLDEIMTDLQFANDELDFGMGLELGLDLFCFGEECLHKDVLRTLPLAYDLLERPEYGRIIRAHLEDRRKGDRLSIKN